LFLPILLLSCNTYLNKRPTTKHNYLFTNVKNHLILKILEKNKTAIKSRKISNNSSLLAAESGWRMIISGEFAAM
jgi:hypothetical protein